MPDSCVDSRVLPFFWQTKDVRCTNTLFIRVLNHVRNRKFYKRVGFDFRLNVLIIKAKTQEPLANVIANSQFQPF